MKSLALIALLAVATAAPLPLVQITVNVDAPDAIIGDKPVVVEGPEVTAPGVAVAELPILDFIHEEVIPAPVELPEAVLPEVLPQPIELPEAALPEVVIPEAVNIPGTLN